tara:strand:+ start:627 stop:881 length:255 start_codon:yes stop_codon:yes gene_type:complete
MKRIRLPKNKFARLGINIFIIVFWFYLSIALFGGIAASAMFGIKYVELHAVLLQILIWSQIIVPIVVTKIIWFPKRPRISRSKD